MKKIVHFMLCDGNDEGTFLRKTLEYSFFPNSGEELIISGIYVQVVDRDVEESLVCVYTEDLRRLTGEEAARLHGEGWR